MWRHNVNPASAEVIATVHQQAIASAKVDPIYVIIWRHMTALG